MLRLVSSQLSIEEIVLREAKEVRNRYPQCSNRDKCLDAVYTLQQRLHNLGVTCAIQFGSFNGNRHAWLDVWTPQGVKLLDITADQWGDTVPEVVFGKMNEFPEYKFEDE